MDERGGLRKGVGGGKGGRVEEEGITSFTVSLTDLPETFRILVCQLLLARQIGKYLFDPHSVDKFGIIFNF